YLELLPGSQQGADVRARVTALRSKLRPLISETILTARRACPKIALHERTFVRQITRAPPRPGPPPGGRDGGAPGEDPPRGRGALLEAGLPRHRAPRGRDLRGRLAREHLQPLPDQRAPVRRGAPEAREGLPRSHAAPAARPHRDRVPGRAREARPRR